MHIDERWIISGIFLFLCFVAFQTNTYHHSHHSSLTPQSTKKSSNDYPEFIRLNSTCSSVQRNSIEYQLKIDHLFNNKNDRSKVIDEIISYFSSLTKISKNEIYQSSYWNILEEYEIKTLHTCGHPRHTFRIRNYLKGANKTLSTVDVKVNAFDNLTWACSQPFKINKKYIEKDPFAFDKLEHGKKEGIRI